MSVKARTFDVEYFGTVGEANLDAFRPSPGCKAVRDLEVGESTSGRIERQYFKPTNPIRVTRVEDKDAV